MCGFVVVKACRCEGLQEKAFGVLRWYGWSPCRLRGWGLAGNSPEEGRGLDALQETGPSMQRVELKLPGFGMSHAMRQSDRCIMMGWEGFGVCGVLCVVAQARMAVKEISSQLWRAAAASCSAAASRCTEYACCLQLLEVGVAAAVLQGRHGAVSSCYASAWLLPRCPMFCARCLSRVAAA